MAKGHPDWFGFSLFPKYGTVSTDGSLFVVADTEAKIVIDISGKGQIFGGWISMWNCEDQYNLEIRFKIDGVWWPQRALSYYLRTIHLTKERNYPFYITEYRVTEQKFSLAVAEGWTFETDFAIEIENNTGADVDTNCRVNYYAVL